MNNNQVTTKQKLIAYLLIFITIITYSVLRYQKNERLKNTQYTLQQSIESVISDSLFYLYNESSSNEYIPSCIDKDFSEHLVNEFSPVCKVLKDGNLKLTKAKLTKNRIYKTKKDKIQYYIYDGYVDLQWTNETNKINSDIETKEVICYIKDDNETYTLANIELNTKKE